MDFVSIDFETANRSRDSACSLGIVKVSGGKIVSTNSYLIKPDPLEFEPINISIHGITPDSVSSSPTFSELWPEISPMLSSGVIVAHNAAFDISVLRNSLAHCNIDTSAINISILCSYRLAQSAFPTLSSYRLDVVCKYLGISLDHHDAVSDAEASAEIVRRISSECGATTVRKLAKEFFLIPGYLCGDRYKCCRWRRDKVDVTTNISVDNDDVCINDDFLGKSFVFTGTLMSMTREKAYAIVSRGGGNVQSNVTKKTNYLVVGLQDIKRLNGFSESSKTRRAQQLSDQGCDIQIIGEDDFISLIDDELYNLCMFGNEKMEKQNSDAYDKIRKLLIDVLNDNNISSKHLEHYKSEGRTCSTESVKIFGNVICQFDISAKSPYIKILTENKMVKYTLCSKSEVYNYFPQICNAANRIIDNCPKEFDCCHMYAACSDAKKCVNPNKDFAMGCGYKKALKSGRIFYGENRNID